MLLAVRVSRVLVLLVAEIGRPCWVLVLAGVTFTIQQDDGDVAAVEAGWSFGETPPSQRFARETSHDTPRVPNDKPKMTSA